jgi:2-keto-4-pentenoate hydratase
MSADAKKTADLIRDLWSRGAKTGQLPEASAPTTRGEGYAAQAALEQLSPKRVGWKIAATSEGGQKHINVDGPLAGRIFEDKVFGPNATCSLTGNFMRVAEPEFAFRFGSAIAPRAEAYTVDEVMAAVESLHLAIELPDSRLEAFTEAGAAGLAADNACAHQLALGEAVTADWRALDLAAHPVTFRYGEEVAHGSGGNVLGDPRVALTWLVNEVTGMGITIGAGEFVTTGTATVPVPIKPGDRLVADFGALGSIGMSLSD